MSEAKTQLATFLTEAEVAAHWRVKAHTLRNARYRGEWLPYVKTPTGSVRYKVDDVVIADNAGNRGFTWEGLAVALAGCKSLDGKQRQEVADALRKWLQPPR